MPYSSPLFYYRLKLSINHIYLFKAFRFSIKQKTKPHNHSDTNSMGHWTTSFAREANLKRTTFGISFTRVTLKKESNIFVLCFNDRTYLKKIYSDKNFFIRPKISK